MSREEVGTRLSRLLVMLPWLASRSQGTSIHEMAQRFETSVNRIEKDLRLLGEVEPEAHLNVSIYEDDRLWFVDTYGHLAQPFRLTAENALGLIIAAQSILQVQGVDASAPLVSAIAKVARAIGGDMNGLEVVLPQPASLDALRDAVEAGACVAIEYYSAARDSLGSRVIEPLALFTVEGRWHLIGFCHTAGAERDFRVDRVRSVASTDETFAPRTPTMRTDVAFDPSPASAVTVRIEIGPEQRWALDRYPVRDVEELADGRVRFTVDATGDAWLERLLLRLGADASVVEPTGHTTGTDAARRLLATYVDGAPLHHVL